MKRMINRAAYALAGALTLGVLVPALPAHALVQCGDLITTSVTLAGDLTKCPLVGIRIGASNVVLDLNGHVIEGEAMVGSGVVIEPGLTNVVVRNGTIRGFNTGVSFSNSVTNSKATGLTLTANVQGVDNNQLATGLAVTGNHIFNNAVAGVNMAGNSHLIQGNSVHDNGVGIRVNGESGSGSGSVVTGNQVYRNNQQQGIWLYQARSAVVSFNQTFQNAQDGIRVAGELSQAQIISNSANANGYDGIHVQGAGSMVKSNSANFNAFYGIRVVSVGVIDGGGNRAVGNGLGTCVNVVCT